MSYMKSFQQFISEDSTNAKSASDNIIRLLGWQPNYVVWLTFALTDDQFISWRPDVLHGRHSRLKAAPAFLFFEDEEDAMLFYLTWRDNPPLDTEDDS